MCVTKKKGEDMAEYIKREDAINACYDGFADCRDDCAANIKNIPAADVVEVVLCRWCVLHGRCSTEDVFEFAGLSDDKRFCGVGKRPTNRGARMEGTE